MLPLTLLLALLFPAAPASAGPKPRGVSVLSRRDVRSTRALLELFTFEGTGKPKKSPGAQSAARSRAEIVVMSLESWNKADREDLDKATISALRKRKLIGIDDGAARLFGRLGFHLSWAKCANGVVGVPTVVLSRNRLLDPRAHGPMIKVFEPPILDSKTAHNNLIFGLHAPRGGQLAKSIEVIARFDHGDYAPIAREGNAVLICVTAPVQDWSPEFKLLVRDVAIGLHGSLKREATGNLARGESEQGGLMMTATVPVKVTAGESIPLSVKVRNGGATAATYVGASSHHITEIEVRTSKNEPVPLTRFGKAGCDQKAKPGLLKLSRTLEETVNLSRIFDLSVSGPHKVSVRLIIQVGEKERHTLEVKDLEMNILDP